MLLNERLLSVEDTQVNYKPMAEKHTIQVDVK